MRGLRSIIISAVALAALGGYIFFIDSERPDTPPKDKVFAVSADAIEELTIKAVGGETTTLHKTEGAWLLVEPVQADADANEPSSITNSLATLEVQRVVDENPSSIADFGLEPARIEIAFKATGETESGRLLIGDKTPTGTDLYAMREGEPAVFLLSSFIENTFNRTSFDLRDKRVLNMDRGAVDSVEVTGGGTNLLFVKHDDAEWNIVKPLAARGDFGAIDGLLNAIDSTQVQQFIAAEAADLAQYGLHEPIASVTLSGDGTQSILTIGKALEGTYYAKDSNRPLIFTVGENLLRDFQKDLFEFRRKDVFEFRTYNATRLEFARAGGTVALEKTRDSDGQDVWKTESGEELETSKAEDPLMKFSNLRADSFDAVQPAALETPDLTVTAVYDDGEKTEVVRFAKSGSDVYAVRQDEPGAAKLPAIAYEDALKALDILEE